MNILELIKQNISNRDDIHRQRAYQDVMSENPVFSSIELPGNGNPENNRPLLGKIATGIANFKQGFNENLTNPLNPQEWQNPQNKTFGNKFGEVMGTSAKILESPLGRGLLTGGIIGLDGGSLGEAVSYGLGATVKNQNLRTADNLYRQKLQEMGYSEEQIGALPGYVSNDVYKNAYDSDMKRLKYENDAYYRQGMLGIRQQDIDLKKDKNFVTYSDYYKYKLENGDINLEEYNKIINDPEYKANNMVNLSAVDSIGKQSKNKAQTEKTYDDIKTSKQNRAFKYKNDGQNVIKVEYGEKPDSRNETHVYYHNKPQYGGNSSNNGNSKTTNSGKPKTSGQKVNTQPYKKPEKNIFTEIYDKFMPLSKKKKEYSF